LQVIPLQEPAQLVEHTDHAGKRKLQGNTGSTVLPPFSQDNWRWCNKCQGLAFAGNPLPGACQLVETHDHAGSGNYSLMQNTPVSIPLLKITGAGVTNVQGLAFAGSPSPGACPAGGTHDHAESGNYAVIKT